MIFVPASTLLLLLMQIYFINCRNRKHGCNIVIVTVTIIILLFQIVRSYTEDVEVKCERSNLKRLSYGGEFLNIPLVTVGVWVVCLQLFSELLKISLPHTQQPNLWSDDASSQMHSIKSLPSHATCNDICCTYKKDCLY